MSRVLRNGCLNRLRSERRRAGHTEAAGETVPSTFTPPDTTEPHTVIETLLSTLPERTARAFAMHYLDDRPLGEVAVELGATPTSVKQRLYRARQKLQEEVIRMAKDSRDGDRLPEAFAAKTIARLLEEGREARYALQADDARERFREVLKIDPDHGEAALELARTVNRIYDAPSDEDAETLKRTAEAAPNSIGAQTELAVLSSGDAREAAVERCLAVCDRRLAADPDDIEALTSKAQMLLFRSDYGEMETVARSALESTPEDLSSLNYLACAISRQSRWDEAYPLYEKLLAEAERAGRNDLVQTALRQMGTCLAFHRGDWKGAARLQEKVWELTKLPNEAGNLIYFYGEAGMVDKAKALFEEVKHYRHPERVYEAVRREG